MIDDAELEELKKDIQTGTLKRFNITCCQSYMTPKGRCYTCPGNNYSEEID